MLSCFQLCETPRTVAHQAPLSVGFSRQEYWGGVSFPSPGDLPNPGIEPASPALAGGLLTTEPLGKLCSSKSNVSTNHLGMPYICIFWLRGLAFLSTGPSLSNKDTRYSTGRRVEVNIYLYLLFTPKHVHSAVR